ncbi:MAG: chromosomal replication initiator protein DnaA [Phycisphaerae bacterium]
MSVLMREETKSLANACQLIQEQLRGRIGAPRFDQWFEPPTRWGFVDSTLTIRAANAFSANWIRTKFTDDLRGATQAALGFPAAMVIETAEPPPASTAPDLKVVEAAPLPTASATTSLNARYTLEEFVCGPSNQLAYRCANAVAEDPRKQFNPLFIHGDCGLGKTHLLQGICRRFQNLHPQKKWLYLTGEQFTNDYLESIRLHHTEAFRRRIRQVDLLVVDDVHFFMNKKHTQEEFLHTFNAMDAAGRQVVLSSDCAPRNIAALTEALSTRFCSGMVARIDSPDLPMRLDILRRLAARRQWRVEEMLLLQLAQQPVASVRELEGLLLQAVTIVEMGRAEHPGDSAALMRTALHGIRDRVRFSTPPGIADIIQASADYFSITPEVITSSSKHRVAATARSIAMYLARRHSHLSFPDVGRAFGGRNHSTVIGACQRVETQLAEGHVIAWANAGGSHHQALAEVIANITASLRRRPGNLVA